MGYDTYQEKFSNEVKIPETFWISNSAIYIAAQPLSLKFLIMVNIAMFNNGSIYHHIVNICWSNVPAYIYGSFILSSLRSVMNKWLHMVLNSQYVKTRAEESIMCNPLAPMVLSSTVLVGFRKYWFGSMCSSFLHGVI